MGVPYSSKAVANSFILKAKEKGCTDISPMKLQKLVYFAHGWFMAFTDQEFIKEEVQAWKFGPVIPDIYFEFKEYGNSNIEILAKELRFTGSKLELITPNIDDDDDDANRIINEVWRAYGEFTPIQLSNITHAKGSPWEMVASSYGSELPKNIEMPNALIKDVFKKKLLEFKNV
ncbi:phage-associated protein [Beggiatoa sp. PS]|nr:phage-associated protein [Beggiatoa sp. PS]